MTVKLTGRQGSEHQERQLLLGIMCRVFRMRAGEGDCGWEFLEEVLALYFLQSQETSEHTSITMDG